VKLFERLKNTDSGDGMAFVGSKIFGWAFINFLLADLTLFSDAEAGVVGRG
jgi:hypothetical protein